MDASCSGLWLLSGFLVWLPTTEMGSFAAAAQSGELELLPGIRLVPAPGHTAGMQVVVIETGERPIVPGGVVAVWFGELEQPQSEGQLRVLAMKPKLDRLAHEHEPWRAQDH